MRILFCCEFYSPSVGGVQEVIKQLAERLVLRGHEVTVATTKLPTRTLSEINGVQIRGFDVYGNLSRGLYGRVKDYRRFVVCGAFDVIVVKAAQQWTFDALWPVLPEISAGKVFIPCGFSGLHEPVFAKYFKRLPEVLSKFDHLIFYASDYRDINLAKQYGLKHYSIIPNGASEQEFGVDRDPEFRRRNNIGDDELLFLTVGNLTGLKGHEEVVKAFGQADMAGQRATLILNGADCINWGELSGQCVRPWYRRIRTKYYEYDQAFRGIYEKDGLQFVFRHVLKLLLKRCGVTVGRNPIRSDRASYKQHLMRLAEELIHKESTTKRVILTTFKRPELVQAYMNSDLFVFASNIEYSPLVLFESVAAGTPFLSVPVGNSEEIAHWTGGGVICPAYTDSRGYVRVDVKVLAESWSSLVNNKDLMLRMGQTGRKRWEENYTWGKIVYAYENVLAKCSRPSPLPPRSMAP